MNWFDIALVTLLLVTMVIGSKKGLIRELMGFFALALGVIVTVSNIDFLALEIARHIDASPMIISVVSFTVLLAVLYGVFRLAGFAFYKVGEIHKLGKRDKVGGAVMGAVKGWILIGLLLFLVTILPMPQAYYRAVDDSILTEPMMRTLPLIFDGTGPLHPRSGSFVNKIEESINQTDQTLASHHKKSYSDPALKYAQRERIDQALDNLDRYFGLGELP
jgi:membrane protein required for colicin V production